MARASRLIAVLTSFRLWRPLPEKQPPTNPKIKSKAARTVQAGMINHESAGIVSSVDGPPFPRGCTPALGGPEPRGRWWLLPRGSRRGLIHLRRPAPGQDLGGSPRGEGGKSPRRTRNAFPRKGRSLSAPQPGVTDPDGLWRA